MAKKYILVFLILIRFSYIDTFFYIAEIKTEVWSFHVTLFYCITFVRYLPVFDGHFKIKNNKNERSRDNICFFCFIHFQFVYTDTLFISFSKWISIPHSKTASWKTSKMRTDVFICLDMDPYCGMYYKEYHLILKELSNIFLNI